MSGYDGSDLALRHFTFTLNPDGGVYEQVEASWRSGARPRKAEITVSPTGRSVHVYVDGEKWSKA